MTAAGGFIPAIVEGMDMNSPAFRRTFPKIVLAVCGIGLLLVFIAVLLTAIGYNT